MNKFSFKIGVRFAASLDMGENFLDILLEVYVHTFWN